MIDPIQSRRDEFYVGYEDTMPAGIARRVTLLIVFFACAAALAIGVTLRGQQRLPASRFEFGVVRPVHGVFRREPYPWLDVDGRRVWLVGRGKHGASNALGALTEGPATVEGSLIQRGANQMLEVATGPRLGSTNPSYSPEPRLGATNPSDDFVTLSGEIVDSKCFLGVMYPAEGTVHRDCARRCLSGGIPPLLLVRDRDRREALIVLVGSDGRPIGQDLAPIAGRPVAVTGRLRHDGHDWILSAEPPAYRPLHALAAGDGLRPCW